MSWFRSPPPARRGAPQRRLPVARASPAELWARWRRLVAALCAALAVLVALPRLMPAQASQATALAPNAALPAGHVLGEGELVPVHVAEDSPALVSDPSQLLGRRLAVPWPAQVPLHREALAGSELLSGAPPGSAAVGIDASGDVTASVLKAGDRVDVVLTRDVGGDEAEEASRTLVSDVPVLWVGAPEAAGGLLAPSGRDAREVTVVVAVPKDQAARTAGGARQGALSLVLRR